MYMGHDGAMVDHGTRGKGDGNLCCNIHIDTCSTKLTWVLV